jgi:hypothetical protein
MLAIHPKPTLATVERGLIRTPTTEGDSRAERHGARAPSSPWSCKTRRSTVTATINGTIAVPTIVSAPIAACTTTTGR